MTNAFEKPDFRALFEAAPGSYLVLLPDLTIVAVSEAYLHATMTRREDILGRALFDVFPDNPDDASATGVGNLRASLERVIHKRAPDAMAVQKYDIRRPESEGGTFEERYWSPVNSPVLGEGGELRYIIHRVDDVTEFVRLRELGSERDKLTDELRTRAGQMESEIYLRAQQLQRANEELRALVEERKHMADRLREAHDELERRVEERTAALVTANADLEREITEREKATAALQRSEHQLRQAQKMEAVGRLAGGIAHDFNNLLSVILSYAALIAADLRPDDPLLVDVTEIEKAGRRAADLTLQMLAFSRQQVLAPKVLDVNEVIGGMDKMLRRIIGEDIDLRTVASPLLGKVKVDPGQMAQVLVNLVVNARDAMPRGGMLTIETAPVVLDDAYAAEHVGARPGPHVMIAVTDTGIGMDKATQAQIFEPFFTTKEQGKGTGLGLSTVFGIVQQSGGTIWLYSEPGRGTTFKIYLPRTDEASEVARTTATSDPAGRGSETILLVEDEEQVRMVARNILKKAGYQVFDASNAAEALLLCERFSGKIHLLVTDVVMPNVSGRELVERLKSSRPELAVMFMSGYTDDAVVRHGVLDSKTAFLQKPLTPESLTRKVREVLDAPTHWWTSRGS